MQKQLGISTIHVCHSLVEAQSVSDRVGVMHQGTVHQAGAIDELKRSPSSEAVARLMGIADCGLRIADLPEGDRPGAGAERTDA